MTTEGAIPEPAAPPAPVPPPARGRRRVVVLVLAALAVAAVLVVAGVLIVQAIDRAGALEEHAEAVERTEETIASAQPVLDEAALVVKLGDDPLVPDDAVAGLTDAWAQAETAAADAADAVAAPTDPLETAEVRDLVARLDRSATRLTAAADRVVAGLDALLLATHAASADADAAWPEGENEPRIAFRLAAADLEPTRGAVPPGRRGEVLATYLAAGAALAASHDTELDEKRGPLFDARMAVQRFARRIAGGVMLEFDWKRLVSGYGENGSYGGTSYWVSDHGGYATITLSNSVAELWPAAGVKALVAHEVGHAILSRPDCYRLYFESDLYPGDEESWATAWAIGRGHDADGSGESVYGRPSNALIALSKKCR